MDFEFIQQLRIALESTNIFSFTLNSIKILAGAFVIFKIIILLLKKSTQEQFDYMEVFRLLGYIVLIGSGDLIINAFEDAFKMIDDNMGWTESNLYADMLLKTEEKLKQKEISFWDIMTGAQELMVSFLIYIVIFILSLLFKVADLSITVSYLLQRLFIIELLKLLLPVALVVSLWKGWENMLISWLKRYFGMLVLGIAYMGIINFSHLVQDKIIEQFNTSQFGNLITWSSGVLIAVIVVFTIKVKLFAVVTSYINGYFS